MLQSEINLQAVTATDHLPKNILCQKNKAKKIKTKTKNKTKNKVRQVDLQKPCR